MHISLNIQIVREHSCLSGFPANRIPEIKPIIGTTTAERSWLRWSSRQLAPNFQYEDFA